MKKINIKEIKSNSHFFAEKLITLGGWIRSLRRGKENAFIILNDGSCFESIQVFFPSAFKQKDQIGILNIGSSIEIKGIIKITPEREQKFELHAREIVNFCLTSENYPIQKKNLPLSFVRDYSQFKAKTNYFSAMFRLRSKVKNLIDIFFEKNGFFYINTPIITANDAEGGGESFTIEEKDNKNLFFGKKSNLTVSGQLHAESLAQGLGKVYNFSPCFRAEKSNTNRHLSEFWMIEAEATFFDLQEIIEIAEELIKFVISKVLEDNKEELLYFEKYNDTKVISDLEKTIKEKFPRITYTECINILEQKNKNYPNFFEFNEIFWGMDFNSEHEKYLAQIFGPIFITNYPSKLKSFYMKENDDEKTVSCVDLIFPKIGEIIGGSVREDKFEKLKVKVEKLNIDINSLEWYIELRKNGYAPSAGFGLGFERFLMFLTKSENIKDTIPFPVYSKKLDF
jgi:asparaginyl-tRNA synthetase